MCTLHRAVAPVPNRMRLTLDEGTILAARTTAFLVRALRVWRVLVTFPPYFRRTGARRTLFAVRRLPRLALARYVKRRRTRRPVLPQTIFPLSFCVCYSLPDTGVRAVARRCLGSLVKKATLAVIDYTDSQETAQYTIHTPTLLMETQKLLNRKELIPLVALPGISMTFQKHISMTTRFTKPIRCGLSPAPA